MVTGRISLRSPEYSPISSSVSVVRLSSSCFHCRAETVLVTRIRVVALMRAIAAAPTIVLPAPQGSTTTPEPPATKASAARSWYLPQRPAVLDQVDGVRLAVDVAGEVLGRPAELEQRLLEVAALGGVDDHRLLVERARRSSARSSCCAGSPRARRGRASAGSARGPGPWTAAAGRTAPWCRRRRPAAHAAPGSGSRCSRTSTTCSASWPAARAFHSPSGVMR